MVLECYIEQAPDPAKPYSEAEDYVNGLSDCTTHLKENLQTIQKSGFIQDASVTGTKTRVEMKSDCPTGTVMVMRFQPFQVRCRPREKMYTSI